MTATLEQWKKSLELWKSDYKRFDLLDEIATILEDWEEERKFYENLLEEIKGR